MKENEAPEKIYIIPHSLTGGFCHRWFDEPLKTGSIEYVRKDAFIEKAEKWLNEHILDYVYTKEWGQGVGVEDELFDDFKEYMKGE